MRSGVDYGTWVCNTDGSAKRERRFLSDVLARGADGLVIASVEPDHDHVLHPDPLQHARWCAWATASTTPMVDRVIAADGEASQAAVAHLLAQGARRIATIQGPRGLGLARVAGYEAALRPPACGPRSSCGSAATGPAAAGSAAMHRLMRLPSRPDAVFCANDLMAIGALDAARELGLRVPDDVRDRRLRRHRGGVAGQPGADHDRQPRVRDRLVGGQAGARPAAAPAHRTAAHRDAALPAGRPRDVTDPSTSSAHVAPLPKIGPNR